MLIEAADIEDAQVILDLQKLAYRSEAAITSDYTIPPLVQSLEEIEQDFREQVVLKAAIDGRRIIGSVRGYIKEGTCYIGRLIVHPDFQNQGIGTQLMRAIEGHFAEADRYELFTGQQSERNIYLYQKLGYRILRSERLSKRVMLVYLEKRRDAS
ncbi:MAG: GNAT family N-acetyltransferase [Anaerolineae bacterium]|nr:GNAT family N-acetyltransferase [Anaerolineae bacterium]